MKYFLLGFFIFFLLFLSACTSEPAIINNTQTSEPTSLRLGVSLTPQELNTFQASIQKVMNAHPEWEIIVENTPQSGIVEKINTQISAGELPDIVRLPGLFTQQWIRNNVFLNLSDFIERSSLDIKDFYSGPLEQFEYQDKLWGLPDTAAPDVVFYNKDMFDAAGLSYPTDNWSFMDMREAAVLLTLDVNGNNPLDEEFDPSKIQQWGWNGGITNLWQRHLVRPFGGDFCENDECTQMKFTDPVTTEAINWWASLVNQDHAAPYDPYGGSQTGVPGDPFTAGVAAMGFNGFFAVGQLNDMDIINYDIVQPFLGENDARYTPLSTNGYLISANTEFPGASWMLLQELIDVDFLMTTWGTPGHSVPARRSAAKSVINHSHSPDNQEAILSAMEYGEVFKPYTSSAFEAFGKTSDLFTLAMKGERDIFEIMRDIEVIANDILARDRQP